MIILRKN